MKEEKKNRTGSRSRSKREEGAEAIAKIRGREEENKLKRSRKIT